MLPNDAESPNDVSKVILFPNDGEFANLEVDKEEMENFQSRAVPRHLLYVIPAHLIMIVIVLCQSGHIQ